jgi:hypothetical protein
MVDKMDHQMIEFVYSAFFKNQINIKINNKAFYLNPDVIGIVLD